MPKPPPSFKPFPTLDRPFMAWAPERWRPQVPTQNQPELEVYEPPVIDPDDLPALLAEAREEGASEAREAMEEELASLRAVVEEVGPALEELARLRHTTLVAAAEEVADIIRLFAHKIVGDSLALHPDALPKLVQDAIAQLPEADEITIEVSPAAAETLSRHLDASLRDRVIVDPELEAGAIVRTRHATLDASLRHAESALETAIQGWLSEQWWVDGP